MRIVKFNGGAGAILCNGCRVIVREHLTKEEIEDETPVFCRKCQQETNNGLVAELADAPDSKSGVRKDVRVRVPPRPLERGS